MFIRPLLHYGILDYETHIVALFCAGTSSRYESSRCESLPDAVAAASKDYHRRAMKNSIELLQYVMVANQEQQQTRLLGTRCE